MSRKRLVREYTPDFAAGNYKPGDGKMGRHGGKGLQSQGLGKIPYDAQSELTSHGEQWPRKHKTSVAMGEVEESGADHDSAGGHASSVGKPTDGHTKNVNHDWPKKAKNTGGTTAMKGDRYSDGGVLHGGSTGSEEVSESWTPKKISQLLGEDEDLQGLFDKYAKNRDWICLESFGRFCQASGLNIKLDESSLLNLMDRNRDFTFYEGTDSDGQYWTPIVEDFEDFDGYNDDEEDMDDEDFGVDDDIDDDGIDDDFDSDFDGEMTDSEHHDLHAKIQEFCDKYGCPADELHELCHEYAQTPMGETDEEDFDGETDEGYEDDDFEDDGLEYGEEEDYEDDMGDESMEESWSESPVDESMDECWSEEVCNECSCAPCECGDSCERCGKSPCRCGGMHESRKPRRSIKENRNRRK